MNSPLPYRATGKPDRLSLYWLHLIGELAIVPAAFLLAHYIRFDSGVFGTPVEYIPLYRYFLMGAVFSAPYIVLNFGHGLYSQKVKGATSEEIGALANAGIQGFFLLVVASFFIRDFPASRLTLILVFVLILLGCFLWRMLLRFIRYERLGKGIGLKSLVVIGDSPLAELLSRRLGNNRLLGYRVREKIGLTDLSRDEASAVIRHIIGDRDDPPALVVSGGLPEDLVNSIVAECYASGVECYMPSDRTGVASLPASAHMLEGVPVVRLITPGELAWVRLKKRIFDLFIVLILLPIWLPILLLLGLVSLIAQGAPVFFIHTRLGRTGALIRLYKLRTMVKDADAIGPPPEFEDKWKARRDPRITTWGSFLRKTSLDELPQLINVLLGDLSLVGPRPVVTAELDNYGPWAALLLSMPPGLTGLWQVSGRSDLSYEQRVELDTYYIQNWSLALDISVILQTIPAVLSRKGAY